MSTAAAVKSSIYPPKLFDLSLRFTSNLANAILRSYDQPYTKKYPKEARMRIDQKLLSQNATTILHKAGAELKRHKPSPSTW